MDVAAKKVLLSGSSVKLIITMWSVEFFNLNAIKNLFPKISQYTCPFFLNYSSIVLGQGCLTVGIYWMLPDTWRTFWVELVEKRVIYLWCSIMPHAAKLACGSSWSYLWLNSCPGQRQYVWKPAEYFSYLCGFHSSVEAIYSLSILIVCCYSASVCR